MQTQYLDEVTNKLAGLLSDLPKADQESEMASCEMAANGYLNGSPSRESPAAFSNDLFSDPSMANLVAKDANSRNALSAESPSELVLNLMPSDGHLD